MKNALAFLLMLLSLNGCHKVLKDDELTLGKQAYNGNALRLDGYYYDINPYTDGIGETYFLYTDGVLLRGGGSGEYNDPIRFMDSLFATPGFTNKAKEHRSNWGVFQIDNDKIVIERWYPSEGPLPAYRHEGDILNDTTFQITKTIRISNNEMTEENQLFHFHAYFPKPDSTNQFIK